MKSLINYLLPVVFFLLSWTSGYSQTAPDTTSVEPNNIITHIRQSNNFLYEYEQGEHHSEGCLDASQPFTIDLYFSPALHGNMDYSIHDENGKRLYVKMIIVEEDQTVQHATLYIDGIPNLICNNYGESVTLTLSTNLTLWSEAPDHPHSIDVFIDLCCKKGEFFKEKSGNNLLIRLDQLDQQEIFNERLLEHIKDQYFNGILVDRNGNHLSSIKSNNYNDISLSTITKTGIYFLILESNSFPFKTIHKIIVIE